MGRDRLEFLRDGRLFPFESKTSKGQVFGAGTPCVEPIERTGGTPLGVGFRPPSEMELEDIILTEKGWVTSVTSLSLSDRLLSCLDILEEVPLTIPDRQLLAIRGPEGTFAPTCYVLWIYGFRPQRHKSAHSPGGHLHNAQVSPEGLVCNKIGVNDPFVYRSCFPQPTGSNDLGVVHLQRLHCDTAARC